MINHGDIRFINGDKVETVDLIIGGSPCQNLSIAGNRKGLDGEQSCLFMEQIRIIKEMRAKYNKPDFMIWENVPGALITNGGKDFAKVLMECIKIGNGDETPAFPKITRWPLAGYIEWECGSVAWRVHDAKFWGVPQRRRRIALVADFRGHSAGKILFEPKGEGRDKTSYDSTGIKNTERTGNCIAINGQSHESGISISDVSHTLKTSTNELVCFWLGTGCCHNMNPTKEGYTLTCQYDANMVCYDWRLRKNIEFAPTMCSDHNSRISDYCALVVEPVIRRLTPLECERLQGYPDGWTNIPGAVDGKRYKALGNSIALPFWQHLLNRIISYCENKTMASLFDGIGGFPLCWSRSGGKTLWISEVDKFCDSVTKFHFNKGDVL
jgi:DNA (cytosine-5)-methyltransferase 1